MSTFVPALALLVPLLPLARARGGGKWADLVWGRLNVPNVTEAVRRAVARPPTVEAAECAPSLALPAMGSDGEPPTVEYADLVKVLEQVKDAAVAHLPSRLIVREASVPQDVQKRLKDYCLSSSHAG